jgi:tetratricopeptide (TPR) repeat protein
MPKTVFVAHDFTIGQGLRADLEYARRCAPHGYDLEFPGATGDLSQGEIWRDIVQPGLARAARVIAYMDEPNANVGFEVGYALGLNDEKEAVFARTSRDLPAWLQVPPLNGFICSHVLNGPNLVSLIETEHCVRSPPRPKAGRETLLVFPKTAGANYQDLFRQRMPHWRQMPSVGWSLNDLPQLLTDVGAVVWLILPHREGVAARDGQENAAAAIVAGYAAALGLTLRVLIDVEARVVVDVAPMAIPFAASAQLVDRLEQLDAEFRPATDQPQSVAPSRPELPPAPELDVATYERGFVGRERLLEDFHAAIRGLVQRSQGASLSGTASVQLCWYWGFGGMGKSWFLRKTIIEVPRQVPSARAALVDWDDANWRGPLLQPPQSARDVADAIAQRLAQLYGLAALDPYWHARAHLDASISDRGLLQKRFQADLEAWEADDSTKSALMVAFDRALINVGDGRRSLVLDALRADADLRQTVFRYWLEGGGAATGDLDAITAPDALLANALRSCLRTVASRAPLVLVFDTCEHLSPVLERWLRDLLCPLCDGRTPILVACGSRLRADSGEMPGSRRTWRERAGETRFREVAFDETLRFTVREVETAVERSGRTVTDPSTIALRLHRMTLGVPLALRTALDLWSELGPDALDSEAESEGLIASDRGFMEDVVIEAVCHRFLLHLAGRDDRRQDYEDIVSLSLLPDANATVLASLWGAKNVGHRKRELAMRYALLVGGDLHSTVRAFLRRWWRSASRPPLVEAVIARLASLDGEIAALDHPDDAGFWEALRLRLNIRSWVGGRAALSRFAPALALALAFDNRAALRQILDLALELRVEADDDPIFTAFAAIRERVVAGLWFEPWGADALFQWFENAKSSETWSPIESGALDLIRGLKLHAAGRAVEALDALRSAVTSLSRRGIPRRADLGATLFRIGRSAARKPRQRSIAITALEETARLGYRAGECWYHVGVVFERLNQSDDAGAAFERAEAAFRSELMATPADLDLAIGLSQVLLSVERYPEAEGILRDVVERDPKNYDALLLLATALDSDRKHSDAELVYRKALEADSKGMRAWIGLGRLLAAQHQWEQAEEAFAHTTQLAPESERAWHGRGSVAAARGRLEEAEQFFLRAIQSEPSYVPAHISLANLLLDQSRFDEAESKLRAAIDVDEWNYSAHLGLAVLLRRVNRKEEAEQEYLRSIALRPKAAKGAYYGLGLLLVQMGRFERAEWAFREAVSLAPGEAFIHTELANLLADTGRAAEAELEFRQAIELAPDKGEAHNALAWHLLVTHPGAQALDDAFLHARRAKELLPANPHVHHTLALIALRRGGWQAGREAVFEWLNCAGSSDMHESDVIQIFKAVGELGADDGFKDLLSELPVWTSWRSKIAS